MEPMRENGKYTREHRHQSSTRCLGLHAVHVVSMTSPPPKHHIIASMQLHASAQQEHQRSTVGRGGERAGEEDKSEAGKGRLYLRPEVSSSWRTEAPEPSRSNRISVSSRASAGVDRQSAPPPMRDKAPRGAVNTRRIPRTQGRRQQQDRGRGLGGVYYRH